MNRVKSGIVVSLVLLAAYGAGATTVVVPTDDELIGKADAIVIGTVEGSYVREIEDRVETVHEIRVERSLKGRAGAEELLRVVEHGGRLPDGRGVYVPGTAQYEQGERVLAFLTRNGAGWQTTDMAIGKFRFRVSTRGDRVLVRNTEDVVGWDHSGLPHRETVRRESEFLHYVMARVQRREAATDYFVGAGEVTFEPEPATGWQVATNAAPFPPETYVQWISSNPPRWPNMASGVTFHKRSGFNIAGAGDGGVSAIQSGLAAWNNECASNINLIYGGERATASANFDGVNVVEYNDPQNRVGGSWSGSGTVAITFLSYSGTPHTFSGRTWANITGADVVFQDGYAATNASFATAMTHELGHGIGWRHSNQSHTTGGACNGGIEECTTAAIMNSSVVAGYGFTLQTFDRHAAEAVYPGGSCGPVCTAPAVTTNPGSVTVSSGGSTTLTVAASGTAPLSYQWYVGSSGNTASPVPGGTGASLTVSPAGTTSYWVRVSNACGSANSATATVTVAAAPPPPPAGSVRNDFDGDGRADVFWRNVVTGETSVWFMAGTTVKSAALSLTVGALNWQPASFGDFDGNGRADILWRNETTGETSVWLMSGATPTLTARTLTAPTTWIPVGSGDFDGNGRDDLFWWNTATGHTSVWFMSGATVTTALSQQVANVDWQPVLLGDYNGDGRSDVFWRNRRTGETSVWFMSGATPATAIRTLTAADLNWVPAGSGDFNGDGRDDLLWRNAVHGQNSVWLMNGTSPPTTAVTTAAPSEWSPRAFGDQDGSGTDDIFWWRSTDGQTSSWLMSGTHPAVAALTMQAANTAWRPVLMK